MSFSTSGQRFDARNNSSKNRCDASALMAPEKEIRRCARTVEIYLQSLAAKESVNKHDKVKALPKRRRLTKDQQLEVEKHEAYIETLENDSTKTLLRSSTGNKILQRIRGANQENIEKVE